MIPITNQEFFLNYILTGELPENLEPITREEMYLAMIAEQIQSIDKPTQEQVDIAVNEYLAEHGVAFNTTAEISEVLEG